MFRTLSGGGRKFRRTDTKKQKILELRDKGLDVPTIAKQLNTTKGHIYRTLRCDDGRRDTGIRRFRPMGLDYYICRKPGT